MKCWICEMNEANSKEHNIKKSDLSTQFQNVSQKTPVYKERNGKKTRPIGSIKSDSFKYPKLICEDCNNSKTQPFDLSWETLSKYLSNNWGDISSKNSFNLNLVFQTNPQNEMINVQLFFIKLLGCAIKESDNTSFDTKSLSDALKNGVEHQNVYISFRASEIENNKRYSANSDLEMFAGKDKEIKYLHWYYIVGQFAVDVIYSEAPDEIDLNGALKPSQMGDFISLSKLNYDQNYSNN